MSFIKKNKKIDPKLASMKIRYMELAIRCLIEVDKVENGILREEIKGMLIAFELLDYPIHF